MLSIDFFLKAFALLTFYSYWPVLCLHFDLGFLVFQITERLYFQSMSLCLGIFTSHYDQLLISYPFQKPLRIPVHSDHLFTDSVSLSSLIRQPAQGFAYTPSASPWSSPTPSQAWYTEQSNIETSSFSIPVYSAAQTQNLHPICCSLALPRSSSCRFPSTCNWIVLMAWIYVGPP